MHVAQNCHGGEGPSPEAHAHPSVMIPSCPWQHAYTFSANRKLSGSTDSSGIGQHEYSVLARILIYMLKTRSLMVHFVPNIHGRSLKCSCLDAVPYCTDDSEQKPRLLTERRHGTSPRIISKNTFKLAYRPAEAGKWCCENLWNQLLGNTVRIRTAVVHIRD